jgi:hypothetical protein
MSGTIMNFAASIQTLRKAAMIGASAAALLMLAPSAHASSLVTNGSFEQNGGNSGIIGSDASLTDWNANSGYTFLYTSYAASAITVDTVSIWSPISTPSSNNGFTSGSPDGGAFVAADGDYGTQPLTQTINGLTVGDTYAVSFYWAASQQTNWTGDTLQDWIVSLGSQTFTTPTYSLPSEGFSGWMPETFVYTATNTSETLSFLAYGNVQYPPFLLLDGVTMAPTPEPATLPLLFTGLMGGMGVLRSRKWLKRSR